VTTSILEFRDTLLLGGKRTPFVRRGGAFGGVPAAALSLKAAGAAAAAATAKLDDIATAVVASPETAGWASGIGTLALAANAVSLGQAGLLLAAGARTGGETTTAAWMTVSTDTLAQAHGISREEADGFATRSFARAMAALHFIAGEIVAVRDEIVVGGHGAQETIVLPGATREVTGDSRIRRLPNRLLSRLKPCPGGVLTSGNTAAAADGAAAILVGIGDRGHRGLARIHAAATVDAADGPEAVAAPALAIRALLGAAGLRLDEIDRIEIEEVSAIHVLACVREMGIDEAKLNVNGGSIAIGLVRAASGLRLALTLARELRRAHLRWGIAAGYDADGTGIAILLENEDRR
jgi:acetyl-CoA C-acetyltransferase